MVCPIFSPPEFLLVVGILFWFFPTEILLLGAIKVLYATACHFGLAPLSNDQFKVYRTSQDARVPQRATEGSAGYDVFSAQDVYISQSSRALVSLDLQFQLPKNCYARIAPRSGLSLKHIDVGAGVVDSDYTGIVKVLLINNSSQDFMVKKGDRIAQIILERIIISPVTELVAPLAAGSHTGWGSTGR